MYNLILNNVKSGVYKSKVKYSKLGSLRVGTVIDEDKSVKWNKDMVGKINEQRFASQLAYRKSVKSGEEMFSNDVIKMIMENYKISEKIANNIYVKAYRDNHSEGLISVLEEAVDIAEIFE